MHQFVRVRTENLVNVYVCLSVLCFLTMLWVEYERYVISAEVCWFNEVVSGDRTVNVASFHRLNTIYGVDNVSYINGSGEMMFYSTVLENCVRSYFYRM